MTLYFYKTGEVNGRFFVKIPLSLVAILNFGNNDKYCFIWSILAKLHPCINNHPKRVSNCRQYFNELKFEGLYFLLVDSNVVMFTDLMNEIIYQ